MTPRATKKALDAIENPGAHPDVWDLVRRGIETGGRIELVQETENDDEDESDPTRTDNCVRRLGDGAEALQSLPPGEDAAHLEEGCSRPPLAR